jgi:hypothetical protein
MTSISLADKQKEVAGTEKRNTEAPISFLLSHVRRKKQRSALPPSSEQPDSSSTSSIVEIAQRERTGFDTFSFSQVFKQSAKDRAVKNIARMKFMI